MKTIVLFNTHSNSFLKNGCLFVAIFLLVVSFHISAVEIPSAVQPGQLEKQLTLPPAPKSQAIEILPSLEQQKTKIAESSLRFKVSDIDFDGATVYPQKFLKSFFADIIGKTVTINQIQTAADNLTTYYRNDGYVLAKTLIPVQTLAHERVKVTIIEGYIESVDLQGDKTDDLRGLIQDYINKVRTTKPIRQAVLERYLLLLNDLPGIYATASLSPSKSQPGAAVLTINIKQKKFGVQLGFNNRLTKLLGTYRGEAYGEANNLLGLQEKTYARVFQSFENKMTILSLGEDLPVFSEGTRLSFMVNQVWSNTPLPKTVGELNSNQVSFNVSLIHPLLRSRTANLSIRGSFSMIDSISRINRSNETISNDRIRSLRVGMTYDLADSWQGVNIADIEVSQGIDTLGARNPSAASRDLGTSKLSVAQGQADYVKANLYVARLQTLAPNWAFLAAFQGQYTEDVLLAPEQFSLGGEQFLRAYDPSEFIGDKGFATKAELRYTVNPFAMGSMTFYGFYDYGEVHYNYNRPSISVGAAGVGMRVSLAPYLSGYIEGAKPLHPNQTTEHNKDMRVFGGIRLSF